MEARLQYAIFREDLEEFEWAARRAAAWLGTYLAADGTTDETVSRDFMHGQVGDAAPLLAGRLLPLCWPGACFRFLLAGVLAYLLAVDRSLV